MAAVTKRTIEIRPGFTGRRSKIEGYVYGEFAAHRHVDTDELWVITLLPLGLNLPPDWCSFKTLERACDAMIEISRLKNSWAVATQEDFTLELKAQLIGIAQRHGAVEGPLGMQVLADRDRFGRVIEQRPNGYQAPLR